MRCFIAPLLGFILLSSVAIATTSAQTAGQWTAQLSYHNATQVLSADHRLFSLTNGSLMSYNTQDNEVRTFSKTDGLSDNNISHLAYSPAQKTLLLIYNNANIDLIRIDTDEVTNLAQVKNSSLSDKTINSVTVVGNEAFLGTNFGVIVLNLQKQEISNTYEFARKVVSVTAADGYLVALTTAGIMRGQRSSNLQEAAAWTLTDATALTQVANVEGTLYAIGSQGLYKIGMPGAVPVFLHSGDFTFANFTVSPFLLGNGADVTTFDPGTGTTTALTAPLSVKMLTHLNGYYWAAAAYRGLLAFTRTENNLTQAGEAIIPNSPIRNYAYYITQNADRSRFLVAGGSLNYNRLTFEGTAMYRDAYKWKNLEDDSVSNKTGRRYVNATAIAESPGNADKHYVSTAGIGLLVFEQGKFVKQYDNTNSPLQSILPNDVNNRDYVRLNGLKFDAEGNLWIVNNEVDTTVRVLTPDDKWHSFYFADLAYHPTLEKMIIDRSGRIWIVSRRTTSKTNAGVFMLTPGVLASTADDKTKFRYTFTNQDGVSYQFNTIYAIAEDLNGQIWVGTSKGPFVISNPADYAAQNFTFTQVKIPRNDGTNYADYLLYDVPITALAVDGANRKWFGTDNDGIYLFSADGVTHLAHFTTANSPLPSNNITDLSISPLTGEVLIGTDAGMIAYQSGVTEGLSELSSNNLKVFPNPVRPEYAGLITITGLTQEADIKITNASGQLVAAGTSEGGTFRWDGRMQSGLPAPSGVYFVLAATADGNKGASARITIIR